MTDLFTESPPQESEAARPAIGTPPDAKACGGDLGPNGYTVEYFARKQAELRAAGERSALEARMRARAAAQEGIDRAVSAADRAIAGWSDLALRYVRLYATQNRGKQFIGYEIVQASIAAGIIQPENAKAWGGPIQRAAREGLIRKVGTAPDPNRHGNPVTLWGAV